MKRFHHGRSDVQAYFRDCVRKHFVHHGEELYEARKHVRNALDLGFLKGAAATRKPADVVPALVARARGSCHGPEARLDSEKR